MSSSGTLNQYDEPFSMSFFQIVVLGISEAFQETGLEVQCASDSRSYHRSELLRIARQYDVCRVPRQCLDWYHSLRFGSLPGFVDEDVRKMATRNPNTMQHRCRDARGDNNSERLNDRDWWYCEWSCLRASVREF